MSKITQNHHQEMHGKVPVLCLAVPPIQGGCKCGAHEYLHKSLEHCSKQYSLPKAPHTKNFNKLSQHPYYKDNLIKAIPNEPSLVQSLEGTVSPPKN